MGAFKYKNIRYSTWLLKSEAAVTWSFLISGDDIIGGNQTWETET